jgi:hypothetical protein
MTGFIQAGFLVSAGPDRRSDTDIRILDVENRLVEEPLGFFSSFESDDPQHPQERQ